MCRDPSIIAVHQPTVETAAPAVNPLNAHNFTSAPYTAPATLAVPIRERRTEFVDLGFGYDQITSTLTPGSDANCGVMTRSNPLLPVWPATPISNAVLVPANGIAVRRSDSTLGPGASIWA